MKESKLKNIVLPMREMLYQYDIIIDGYKQKSGSSIIGYTCEIFPPEIISSFGVIPLKIPGFFREKDCPCKLLNDSRLNDIFDYIIVPDRCTCVNKIEGYKNPYYKFINAGGYGEDASIEFHNSLDLMLKSLNISDIEKIDIEKLQKCTKEYDGLRRCIRGIASIRKTKPDLLSNDDLMVIFEAALSFPPSIIIDSLAYILDALNKTDSTCGEDLPAAMVHSGLIVNGSILDDIEEGGCLIAEDDFCNGRRQFDLSFNWSSNYLYYEILNAFSYRPLCPSIRRKEERFELLYKLLKNHGIKFVVLIQNSCTCREEEIEYLRVKLMRSGIDPVIVKSNSAIEQVKEYVKLV
ncbi:2-hydroxyacyl-CoA dehydratase family protein [Spirochaetota bacterium]